MNNSFIAAARPRHRIKQFGRILTLLIALLVLLFLITIMDWRAFGSSLRRLSPGTIGAAAGLYLLLSFFRSLRFRTLLARKSIPLRWLYPITLYHNFLVRVLPFKLGELSYIVLLRNHLNFSVEEGVSSLFGARMLELLVVVLVGTMSLLSAGELFAGQRELEIFFVLLVIVAGIPGLYFAGALIHFMAGILRRFTGSFIPALCTWLEGLAAQFDRLRQPRLFATALLWSFGTYSCSFSINWILLRAAGIEMEFALLVLVITLGMFAGAFPFNISGFGMVEISWTFGLTVLLGYSAGEAASIGLLLNGFQIVTAVLFGIPGWLILRGMTRQSQTMLLEASPNPEKHY